MFTSRIAWLKLIYMRSFYTLSLLFFIFQSSVSQECLPGTTILETQEDIDSFAVRYPGCSVIEGNLTIQLNEIQNLLGLASVTEIQGDLAISIATSLTSLSGLDSLRHIGGQLAVVQCDSLLTLSGLEQLESVGGLSIGRNGALVTTSHLDPMIGSGGVSIIENPQLTDLSCLSKNRSTVATWIIGRNPMVQDLSGLSSLDSTHAGLTIYDMPQVFDLADLSGLKYVGLSLFIYQMHGLQNMSGLDSLASVGGLHIALSENLYDLDGMPMLDTCRKLWLEDNSSLETLSHLSSVAQMHVEHLKIIDNDLLTNLDGLGWILGASELRIDDMDFLGDIGGLSQISEVSSCIIRDNQALSSLQPLSDITSLSNLWVSNNLTLSDLEGLDNVSEIANNLYLVNNAALSDLTALRSLERVGGILRFWDNPVLTSLDGLEALEQLEGSLSIKNNNSLVSIEGLSNLDPGLVTMLEITKNGMLDECAIESVCAYINSEGVDAIIVGNAPECRDIQTVRENCTTVSSEDLSDNISIQVVANPIRDELEILTSIGGEYEIRLFDMTGQLVRSWRALGSQFSADVSALNDGVFVVSITEAGVQYSKVVVKS